MPIFKTLLPFSALAVTFVLPGIILNDIHQVYFGIIWLLLAAIMFIKRKLSHRKI